MTVSIGKFPVKSLLFHNTNSNSEAVEIHFVPNSGGSVGTTAEDNRSSRRDASGRMIPYSSLAESGLLPTDEEISAGEQASRDEDNSEVLE